MLRDQNVLPGDVTPMLPDGEPGAFSGQDPATMEQMFNPSRTDPPQGMPAGGRMIADASGAVPAPEQRPPMPEQAPGQDLQSLTNPDDSRYKDPQNLLMGNVIMGGMLPWAQAAADVAAGRVPMEQFDETRMEHERRLNELKEQHPDFVSAAEKAMPFLEGLGMGVMKPAKTVVGTMAKGAAVAAPQGAARGYSSGPVEEPSASVSRGVSAVGGAATNAALGAAGGAAAAGASKLIGKTTSVFAERAARKNEETAALKLDNEAKAAGLAKDAKKEATVAKGANTKRLNAMDKDMAVRAKAYDAELMDGYKRHTAMPEGPSKHWEENRKIFAADPIHAFNQAAENGMGLEGMAKALNLPQSVILARLGGKQVKVEGPGHEKLLNDMLEVDRVGREFTKRGLKPAEVAKPAAKPKMPTKAEDDAMIAREIKRRQQKMDDDAPVGPAKQDGAPKGAKAPTYPKTPLTNKPFEPKKGADPRTRAKNDNAPPAGKPLGKKPKWLQTPDNKPDDPPRPQGRGGKKPRK